MSKDPEKFFFHLHNFDNGPEDTSLPSEAEILEAAEEDAPPPPPTFTEEELAAATAKAFEEGRAKGAEDSEASKVRATQMAVQTLGTDIQALITAEHEREDSYKGEVIRVTTSIFEKLFPIYSRTEGLSEMQSAVSRVLETQSGQHTIEILTHSDDQADIERHFKEQTQINELSVIVQDGIMAGNCEIRWKNGGALYNARKVSEDISQLLQQTLEDAGITSHDSENIDPPAEENCAIIEGKAAEKPEKVTEDGAETSHKDDHNPPATEPADDGDS